jgi:hypothetical protein
MNRYGIALVVLAIAALLSACSAATSTPAPTAAPVPTATLAPAAVLPQSAQVVATPLDPCQLVTQAEASALAGTTFGAGQERSNPEGLKICAYSTQSSNVFTVEAAQATSVAEAQNYKDQFLAELQSNLGQLSDQGINVTQLPNFADGAVLASASFSGQGISMNGSAIGVLKGTVFFGFSDVVIGGGAAPTSDALQSEATTVLGRLP